MNPDDAEILNDVAAPGGLTVCTIGGQRVTYVATAVKAVAEALRRQRLSIYGRMLLVPEAN